MQHMIVYTDGEGTYQVAACICAPDGTKSLTVDMVPRNIVLAWTEQQNINRTEAMGVLLALVTFQAQLENQVA